MKCQAAISTGASAIKASGLSGEAISVTLDLYGIKDLNELLALRGKVLTLDLAQVGSETLEKSAARVRAVK